MHSISFPNIYSNCCMSSIQTVTCATSLYLFCQTLQLDNQHCLNYTTCLSSDFPGGSRCINVQILSRSLEAKLTVCHCLVDENNKVGTICAFIVSKNVQYAILIVVPACGNLLDLFAGRSWVTSSSWCICLQ